MKIKNYLLVGMSFLCGFANAQIYSGQKGVVKLLGEAPKETITAQSTALVGKLDLSNGKFNFKQPMNTFSFSQGDPQKKHAEDDFWEVDRYPNAMFSGVIVNDTDISKEGTYSVTVRGIFTLHGIERDVKIPAVLTVHNNTVTVQSTFHVFLSDHNIKIPAFVSLKVSPEFTIDVHLQLTKT